MSATELGTTKPKQQLTWRLQRRNWCPSPTHAVGGCPPRPRLWCRRSRPTAGDTALRCSRGGAGALPAKVKRGMLSRQRASFPRKKTNVAFDEHPQRKPHRSFRHRSSEHSPCRTEEVCTWIHRVALRPCNRCLDGSERHKNDQPCFLVKERHRTGNSPHRKMLQLSWEAISAPRSSPRTGSAARRPACLWLSWRLRKCRRWWRWRSGNSSATHTATKVRRFLKKRKYCANRRGFNWIRTFRKASAQHDNTSSRWKVVRWSLQLQYITR